MNQYLPPILPHFKGVSMFGLGAVWACAAERLAGAERVAEKAR